ncbi:CYTH domain-containing protein [Bacillus sp. FJAT-47783]|uniref:CYTH domain-containing protein n=1 Tax=Bacillus sp. FJAT-47783 TaxID=2922712 RepID=UPI001FABF692|nr:CYTH domain-containing protein [Bacillus sp. FJAT-47783]
MTQEIEIEFKNLLTKEEFLKLTHYFHLNDSSFVTQHNHYFDTKDFSLKKLGAALRIREKKDRFTLTLKQPAQVGLLETHQLLSEKEVEQAIQHSILPATGEVIHQLSKLHIKAEDLQFFGTLTTDRAEVLLEEGLIVLDHSRYLKKEDFEIEFEVQDEELGKKRFRSLLQSFHIPIRHTDNKIKRFYLAKYKDS